jgi:hypothetical protein
MVVKIRPGIISGRIMNRIKFKLFSRYKPIKLMSKDKLLICKINGIIPEIIYKKLLEEKLYINFKARTDGRAALKSRVTIKQNPAIIISLLS